MFTLSDALCAALAPLASALLLALSGRRRTGPGRMAAAGAATALGYVVGELALRARSLDGAAWLDAAAELARPHDAVDWIPSAVLVALLPGTGLAARSGSVRMAGTALLAALAAFIPWRLLDGSRYLPSQELRDAGFADDAISPGAAAGLCAVFALLVVALGDRWRRQRRFPPAVARGGLAVAVLALAAATLGLSGSFRFALSLGALAASLSGAVLGALAGGNAEPADPERPGDALCPATVPATIGLAALLLCGVAFAELAWWRAALLGAAWFFAAGRARLPGTDGRLNWLGATLLVLAPALAAAGTAGIDFARAIQSQPPAEANPYEGLY